MLMSQLLHFKQAVLGFMKVVVSCLQPKDLQSVLSDILNGVLPWSSVSRNHFRSKACANLLKILDPAHKFILFLDYLAFNIFNEHACPLLLQVTVIVEIAARKCGSAAVKLLTPEKYKGFVKAIIEVIFLPRECKVSLFCWKDRRNK